MVRARTAALLVLALVAAVAVPTSRRVVALGPLDDDGGGSGNETGGNETEPLPDGGNETNDAPNASFTTSCTGLNCTFDATNSSDSDGEIAAYDWDLGDNTTATGEIVDHRYNASGSYTVELTVTDDDNATDTTTRTVEVSDSDAGGNETGGDDGNKTNDAPDASFTASCTGLSCTFDASNASDPDGEIVAYDWDLGDNSTATGEIVDHRYNASGSYTVELTVTDDDNATDTATRTVEVTAPDSSGNATGDGDGADDGDGTEDPPPANGTAEEVSRARPPVGMTDPGTVPWWRDSPDPVSRVDVDPARARLEWTLPVVALLLFIPLYRRLTDDTLLDNATRREALEVVTETPGQTAGSVADALDVTYQTARYHLDLLVEFDRATQRRIDGRVRYFPIDDGWNPVSHALEAATSNDSRRRLLDALAEAGEATAGELADRADLSPSNTSYHLSRLHKLDLVRRRRDGTQVRYRLPRDVAGLVGEIGD